MKTLNILTISFLLLSVLNCSSSKSDPSPEFSVKATPQSFDVGYESNSVNVTIATSGEWSAFSDDSWISCNPKSSLSKDATIVVTIAENRTKKERKGTLVVKSGTARTSISITQEGRPDIPVDPSIIVPEGYELVWNDEFNSGTEPGADWWYETGGGGWGNHELQTYVAGSFESQQLATVEDGVLSIIAKKISGNVYSIRMNTTESWKYGYFEARLKLPKGKGTWPAFWMMPKNFTTWPGDGEIDIMEEVGYNPNYVSSSIHCDDYNHMKGTQKTREIFVSGAQTDFHVYALEWTEDFIRTYVDGEELFYFENDKTGNKRTWPFNAPFYLKLNLAWGGDWGGAMGVDDSALPATYQIDYVRVFQKK